jgi:hypothetical protein
VIFGVVPPEDAAPPEAVTAVTGLAAAEEIPPEYI